MWIPGPETDYSRGNCLFLGSSDYYWNYIVHIRSFLKVIWSINVVLVILGSFNELNMYNDYQVILIYILLFLINLLNPFNSLDVTFVQKVCRCIQKSVTNRNLFLCFFFNIKYFALDTRFLE